MQANSSDEEIVSWWKLQRLNWKIWTENSTFTHQSPHENIHKQSGNIANGVRLSLAQKGKFNHFCCIMELTTHKHRQANHIGNDNGRLATDPKSNTHKHIAQTTNATDHMSRSRILCMYNEIWVSTGHRACNAINMEKWNVGSNSFLVIKIFSIYLYHVLGAASATSTHSHLSANWIRNVSQTYQCINTNERSQRFFSVSFVIECQEVESDVWHVQHHMHHFASNVHDMDITGYYLLWFGRRIV